MFAAKELQFGFARFIALDNFFSEISERCVDPKGAPGFFVYDRNDSKPRQARFAFIADLNNHQVMPPGKRLEVVKISFIDKIRDQDDHTAAFNDIERKRDR